VETPVLIVGAGPVGLSASVLLSRHGIAHVICDRAASTTDHPRARSINIRTLEIFRQWGIEDALRAVSLPPAWSRQMIYTTTLAGPEHGRTSTGSMAMQPGDGPSPTGYLLSSQDRIEPILRQTAESYPTADVRFGTEFVGHVAGPDGIRATLRDRQSGETLEVEAAYLIGADGFASSVRQSLGIDLVGETGLSHSINTYFRADLSRWIEDRPASLYWISGIERAGVLQPLDGGVRWLCQIGFGGQDGKMDAWTAEDSARWVRAAVGAPDVPVEVLKILPWTMSATVADRFQVGRVFLVGDAVHQLPPTGGFGMNSGVQDAHSLCWKIAAVLKGWAAPSLLDTYEAERRPVALFNIDRSVANFRAVQAVTRAALSGGAAEAVKKAHFYGNFIGQELGFHYEAGAVIPDGTAAPTVENPVTDYVPVGRPGHRAPHVALRNGTGACSTLDLFETEMVLLAGPHGATWRDAAQAAAGDVPLRSWTVGAGGELTDPDGDWRALYGVGPDGAVLVRPDGHVAWRGASMAPDPRPVMAQVFDTLFRN
jgi:2-polyprenyl-6-methoxyphenol hydroxylase-like FAD-dependent oxidoreductase